MSDKATAAAQAILRRLPEPPAVGIVLGSGLAGYGRSQPDPIVIPYTGIPHIPMPTVPGHEGEFVFARISGVPTLIAKGRFHYYEGHDLETVQLGVRIFHELGVKALIITNAAGVTTPDWSPGDLMLITGHLDCTFRDGPADPVPVTGSPHYHTALLDLARNVAVKHGITLREGYYSWSMGPTFETPAEIAMIRRLGGKAVGMSTVPEIMAAGQLGLPVLGISCLANYAAGILDQPLDHEEVLETGRRVQQVFATLITSIVSRIAQ